MNSIKQIGKAFAAHLDQQNIILTKHGDGRLESLASEDAVRRSLIKEFSSRVNILEKNHNRSFGDIDINLNGNIYSINIKMVDPAKSGTYNGGGVKVFNHILFGCKDSNFKRVATRIVSESEALTKLTDDYYYLVFYKRSNMPTVFASLSELSEDSVITNPSNPIQLKKNLKTVNRTDSEKVQFIVNLFRSICYKKAQAYLILEGKAA